MQYYDVMFSCICLSVFVIFSSNVSMPSAKSWNFYVKFPGAGKYWKMILVLENPGNLFFISWKVLEFDGTQMQ